jgi:hypothetical protein
MSIIISKPNPRDHKELLYPRFADKMRQFEMKLWAVRLPFYSFCGLRSFEEQAVECLKGRMAPGPECMHKGESKPRPIGSCQIHPFGLIVTKARPGESWHQYGLADDYVPDGMAEKPSIQWSWQAFLDADNNKRNDWVQMATIARDMGLDSAWWWKEFKEAPHVQCTFGLTLPQAQGLYKIGGLPRVWAELDKAA